MRSCHHYGSDAALAGSSPELDEHIDGALYIVAHVVASQLRENRMAGAPGKKLSYEPGGNQLLQIYDTATGADTRFGWSGDQMISEINTSGWTVLRRYVPGPGTDEPVVWYEGSGTSDRRWLHADERGSVVAISNGSGVVTNVHSYDEYGIPAAGNVGRFQYTGPAWFTELGMRHAINGSISARRRIPRRRQCKGADWR